MQKEIAFRELLDSSILVEYDENNDVYTLVVSGGNGGGSGNESFIGYSGMINFFENIPNFFSIFYTFNSQDEFINSLENKIKNNLHIKEIYLNIIANTLESDLDIIQNGNIIGTISSGFIGILKISNLNYNYDIDDIILFSTTTGTGTGSCFINQINFKI